MPPPPPTPKDTQLLTSTPAAGPGPSTRYNGSARRQSSGGSAGNALRDRNPQQLEDASYHPSPFANEEGHGMGLAFGGSSADLYKYTSFGNFPSIPQVPF